MSLRPRRSLASRFTRSPAHRPLLETRTRIEHRQVMRAERGPNPPTAYCASPYKTGTTYLAGRFADGNRAAHEPMHHTTIRHLDDIEFLRRRRRHLALDLESSGLFAHRLEVLRESTPDSPFLLLYRPFDEWVISVVGYMTQLSTKVHHNYVARLVFDPVLGRPIESFSHARPDQRREMLERLYDYWSAPYRWGLADQNTMIVPLAELDERISDVASCLGLTPPAVGASAWRRSNPSRPDLDRGEIADVLAHIGPAHLDLDNAVRGN